MKTFIKRIDGSIEVKDISVDLAGLRTLPDDVVKMVSIHQDDDAESPREWDNAAYLSCAHRRYNLGDYQSTDRVGVLRALVEKYIEDAHAACAKKTAERLTKRLEFIWENEEKLLSVLEQYGAVLPLYLYDHSGITMRTAPFSCQWDSGQVGYAAMSRWSYRLHTGKKAFDKMNAEDMIRMEVAQYDIYLTGDCYSVEYLQRTENGFDCSFECGILGAEEADKRANEMVRE